MVFSITKSNKSVFKHSSRERSTSSSVTQDTAFCEVFPLNFMKPNSKKAISFFSEYCFHLYFKRLCISLFMGRLLTDWAGWGLEALQDSPTNGKCLSLYPPLLPGPFHLWQRLGLLWILGRLCRICTHVANEVFFVVLRRYILRAIYDKWA